VGNQSRKLDSVIFSIIRGFGNFRTPDNFYPGVSVNASADSLVWRYRCWEKYDNKKGDYIVREKTAIVFQHVIVLGI
jgi:hypothetical protein